MFFLHFVPSLFQLNQWQQLHRCLGCISTIFQSWIRITHQLTLLIFLHRLTECIPCHSIEGAHFIRSVYIFLVFMEWVVFNSIVQTRLPHLSCNLARCASSYTLWMTQDHSKWATKPCLQRKFIKVSLCKVMVWRRDRCFVSWAWNQECIHPTESWSFQSSSTVEVREMQAGVNQNANKRT
jgi:hypothetical protein